jgi:hypothetical protein
LTHPATRTKKLVLLIVRYFHAEKGVMVRVLELVNLGGENTDLLLSYVLEVLQKLDFERVIAMSAENISANIDGKKRKRKNNLYHTLQAKTSNNFIGIGCPAHVVQTEIIL